MTADLYSLRLTEDGEAFAAAYAERSGVTVEWLRENGREARPCRCGEDDCAGWAMVNAREYDEDLQAWRDGRGPHPAGSPCGGRP